MNVKLGERGKNERIEWNINQKVNVLQKSKIEKTFNLSQGSLQYCHIGGEDITFFPGMEDCRIPTGFCPL